MAGQIWQVNADGGFLSNAKLSRQIRHASQPMMKFRQFVRKEPAAGKGKGATVDFRKISNIQTAGGQIAELSKMPETKVLIRTGQLTITEYGNSIPYTGKLDTLSEFSVDNIITKALRDDIAKVLDSQVATAFKDSDLFYVPSSSTAGTFENTLTTVGTDQLNLSHIREIVDALKTGIFNTTLNPVPPWDGENYICVASVKALRGIKNDPDYEEVKKFADPDSLLTGEVGRIEGVRFIETNHTTSLSNAKGANSIGEAVIFGADPVIEGMAVPEEIRRKIPMDYGRDKGIGWYALLGYKLVWSRSVDSEQHVVFVTSA